MGKIIVLRLGHRRIRDQRITTHVFLAARAFGADEGVLCGESDASVVEGITRVSEQWGGGFKVSYEENWKKYVMKKKRDGWKIAHLTMYGLEYEKFCQKKPHRNFVVVVGAGKVPKEMYEMADFNVSVLSQPHSEVSAIAVFLDRMGARKKFQKAMLRIVPDECGKVVVRGENGRKNI